MSELPWRVLLYTTAHQFIGEVTPIMPEFEIGLNKVGFLNFNLNKTAPFTQRAYLEPYATDFELYVADVPIMGGLIASVGIPNFDQDQIQVAGRDWLHYLERRQFPFDPSDPTFYNFIRTEADVFDVIESFVHVTLLQPNSLSMTTGNGELGKKINYKIDNGDTEYLLSKIDSLSSAEPGFDYWTGMSPSLRMAAHRGTNTPYQFDRNNIQELPYTDNGLLGNHVLGFGSGSANKLGSVQDDLSSQLIYRRHDVSFDYGEISSIDLVTSKVRADLKRASKSVYDLTVKLRPEKIEEVFGNVQPGDVTKVDIDLGYMNLSIDYRVVTMNAKSNEQGDIEVVVGFNDA